MPGTTVRTTIALPEQLLNAVDRAVLEGKAKSRNELLATAVRHELAALERVTIDAEFAGMARDWDYQKDARQIADDFTGTDWSAFLKAEKSQ